MERDKLCSKIRDYKNGNRIALNEIISQMTPLVKKICTKMFFLWNTMMPFKNFQWC